ncbi:Mss4-like protein [Aspergillus flavus]|uniref:Mss4-like protein n=1 Tax=Aspergillus flavus (strain ATCC 200026 / FGSC A1120 / IAM 13836 / NRRL 3357 / JCM 12722 / SRRC 167) TaxID=332952 RepID=A0A7U2R183_ASPFN|nr:Mss4-like protein [Aspergillus flavus]
MSYEGHCICGRIRVLLEQQPPSSLVCHCHNCSRSGGGSSINYVLHKEEVTIQDPQSSLKVYEDSNTVSGNHIQRKFCSNCGRLVPCSPILYLLLAQLAENKDSPIMTESPSLPGKAIVKASLFDVISQPDKELFTADRQAWKGAVEGAKQE